MSTKASDFSFLVSTLNQLKYYLIKGTVHVYQSHLSASKPYIIIAMFLNQARTGRRAPGFLKLFLCGRLYACVFVKVL